MCKKKGECKKKREKGRGCKKKEKGTARRKGRKGRGARRKEWRKGRILSAPDAKYKEQVRSGCLLRPLLA